MALAGERPTTGKLHLVARDLRFVPGDQRAGKRDSFEVIDEAGNVSAVIYMAAAVASDLREHIVQGS